MYMYVYIYIYIVVLALLVVLLLTAICSTGHPRAAGAAKDRGADERKRSKRAVS